MKFSLEALDKTLKKYTGLKLFPEIKEETKIKTAREIPINKFAPKAMKERLEEKIKTFDSKELSTDKKNNFDFNVLESKRTLTPSVRRTMGVEHEYSLVPRFIDDFSSFLTNGGLLYEDYGHLEYASPETSNALDVLIWDKAGEILTLEHAKEITSNLEVKVIKNNYAENKDDGSKQSDFGTHENYMVENNLQEELLSPFLATRILFTGSGKLEKDGTYKISQKADFLTTTTGGSSTSDKGFISSKEESHMTNGKRRLHMTVGEANMSEVAGLLKYGTTNLVINLLEDGLIPKNIGVHNSLDTIKEISNNTVGNWQVSISNGRSKKATDIQRIYLNAAKKAYAGQDQLTDNILTLWRQTLDDLDADPKKLSTTVDWIIKKNLLEHIADKHGIGFSDKKIQNANIQYHDVDRNTGLFYFLERNGLVTKILDDKDVKNAIKNPPSDTRAYLRGKLKSRGYDVEWIGVSVSNTIDTKCISCPSTCNQLSKLDQELTLDDPMKNYKEVIDLIDKEIESNEENYAGINFAPLVESLYELIKGIEFEVKPYSSGVTGKVRLKSLSEHKNRFPGYGVVNCSCYSTVKFQDVNGNTQCVNKDQLEVVVENEDSYVSLNTFEKIEQTIKEANESTVKNKGSKVEIKVGMDAEIRSDSEYHNQKEGIGKITSINTGNSTHTIRVKWDSYNNIYRPRDLNIITQKELDTSYISGEQFQEIKCEVLSSPDTKPVFKAFFLEEEKNYVADARKEIAKN